MEGLKILTEVVSDCINVFIVVGRGTRVVLLVVLVVVTRAVVAVVVAFGIV